MKNKTTAKKPAPRRAASQPAARKITLEIHPNVIRAMFPDSPEPENPVAVFPVLNRFAAFSADEIGAIIAAGLRAAKSKKFAVTVVKFDAEGNPIA